MHGRLIMTVYGRTLAGIGVVLLVLARLLSPWLLGHLTSPRLAPLATLVTRIHAISGWLLVGYGLWVLVTLVAWLRLRRRPAVTGQWYLLRIPKPMTTDPHSATAAQLGQREAAMAGEIVRVLQAIVAHAPADRRIALELWYTAQGIAWSLWLSHPDLYAPVFSAMQGFVPGGDLLAQPDPVATAAPALEWTQHSLAQPAIYPLRRADAMVGDPLDALIGGLRPQQGVTAIGLSLTLGAVPDGWQRQNRALADWLALDAKEQQASASKETAVAMLAKLQSPCVTIALRTVVLAESAALATAQHQILLGALDTYTMQHDSMRQAWTHGRIHTTITPAVRDRHTVRWLAMPLPPLVPTPTLPVLSLPEVTALWHLPTGRHLTVAIWRNNRFAPPSPALMVSPIGEPPPAFAATTPLKDRIVRITGGVAADGQPVYLGFPLKSYTFHQQITASTGAGKSHAAKVQLGELLRIGAGFGVIDFKGDLVNDLLTMIPDDRLDDVIVFDPLDPDHCLGLNLLDPTYLNKDTEPDFLVELLEALVASTDSHWGDSAGMQEALRYGALTLMEGEPTPTIAHLYLLFSSSAYRATVLERVTDPDLVLFWTYQFPKLSDTQKSSMTALQRRLSQFLINRTVRITCNQTRTTIPFRQVMDQRKIVLAKLPVELIGATAGGILANVLINLVLAAAFSRLDTPEDEREPWVLVVDEFQEAMRRGDPANYQKILERLRSFGIGLVLMHQGTSQLPAEMLATTLEIVQTRLILSAFGPDAAVWQRQYPDARLTMQDWAGIPLRDEGYAAISINGFRQPICTITPLPLWPALPQGRTTRTLTTLASPPRDPLDERLRALAQFDRATRLRLLRDAPPALWEAILARMEQDRADRHAQLLAPTCPLPRAARVLALSHAKAATPRDLALAALTRLTLSIPRDTVDDEPPAKGKRGRSGAAESPSEAAPAGSPVATPAVVVNPRKVGVATVMQAEATATNLMHLLAENPDAGL
ncbi:hypothetical protein Haur_5107 (plasmid) [Herpetosiphon aurantiacus DSM 785]|uniref:Uncharacterized protein n=1 Tax=Herpetosiphon aurantiacus (strain ATCC 23779 / DSM 785 / 114-95) TaxID=316274 RepID=A9B8S1_HERA2|nr:hypothetical protein Haur_5107 [Herpetosiphon aurantiacus DSM 785]